MRESIVGHGMNIMGIERTEERMTAEKWSPAKLEKNKVIYENTSLTS